MIVTSARCRGLPGSGNPIKSGMYRPQGSNASMLSPSTAPKCLTLAEMRVTCSSMAVAPMSASTRRMLCDSAKCVDGSIRACRGVLHALHGCGCAVAEHLILPLVQGAPRHAYLLGHCLRAGRTRAQGDKLQTAWLSGRELLGSTNDARPLLRMKLLKLGGQQCP